LAWALPRSLWADRVSSERQIDVFPPCARTHTQAALLFYWDKHTCMYTFGQLANVYTFWLIAEREREREREV